MGIFNVLFSDIEWGEDEAKNDEDLDNYFVEFPGYDKIIQGKKRFIVGRKGTGKSAILQKIRLKSLSDATYFYIDISLRDFPLNDFKALGEKGHQDKSKYVSAWKFLLLVEIAGMVLEDNSVDASEELDNVRTFINQNFPNGISVVQTVNTLRENENKVTVMSSWLGGEIKHSRKCEQMAQVHYNKLVTKLAQLLKNMNIDSRYFLLIDELDEGYKQKNSNLNVVILALLRAADEIYNEFKNNMNCIPVTALRSDIFDNLEDNDLNKLDDYVLRLNWTTDENAPRSLKKIAEKRIEATLRKKYPQLPIADCWDIVADDSSAPKGLWQYICALTFSRPRDIIKLLKYCSQDMKGNKLTLSEVQSVEDKYSDWFYREFRDEAQSFLSCWKGALNCISEIAQGKDKVEKLEFKLSENSEVKEWCKSNNKTVMDVIKILFNYSVIGCINEKGRWIFKYKDEYFEFMTSYPDYCVHYGFCRKLRIPKSYDKIVLDANRQYI